MASYWGKNSEKAVKIFSAFSFLDPDSVFSLWDARGRSRWLYEWAAFCMLLLPPTIP